MTRDQYLSLVDTLGRVVRAGKRGFISADLPPIQDRLGVGARILVRLLSGSLPNQPASATDSRNRQIGMTFLRSTAVRDEITGTRGIPCARIVRIVQGTNNS